MKNFFPKIIYETDTYEKVVKNRAHPPGLEYIPYDEAAFARTDIGIRRDELTALFNVYHDDPMNPNVLRHWGKMGLKKELFDNEGKYGFAAPHEYSVFTPLDIDRNKKYALIYFCHGGGQPVEWAETYGVNRLAAVEKYIVVYAQNGGRSNEEAVTEFERITGEIRKRGYPIDWERVYVAGFSSGSSATGRIAVAHAEKIAAIGSLPDGLPFQRLKLYEGPHTFASAKGRRVPGIYIGGAVDQCDFPAGWAAGYFGSEIDGAGTVQNGIENLDIWLREIAQVKNYTPLTYEDVMGLLKNSDDPIEREFGLRFERKYSFHVQSVDWLGGEFFGEDGAPVMRWARAKGVPHMVWESQTAMMWDYLKHFRRDEATGKSIYDPIVCWGER